MLTEITSTRHNLFSSHREAILEHVFIGELLRSLWVREVDDVEVLRPEVDSAGYDLAIECRGHLRHIQLKSSFLSAKTRSVAVSTRLAEKPSGCVVWVCFNQDDLQPRVFKWFGCEPGEKLPDIMGYPVARQARANSQGFKAIRPYFRLVPKSVFKTLDTMNEVAEKLFGR
ncbi:MAG: hypothetical protein ACJ76Y_22865 [Thermoanaerobaculia bacterium]